MNLDSARNRIKIIEGLSARIMRFGAIAWSPEGDSAINDAATILKQCRFLEIDLRETEEPVKDYNASLGGVAER